VKITVRIGDEHHTGDLPHNQAAHVLIDTSCPKCKASPPLSVSGLGIRETTHDTYVATAKCNACGEVIGEIRACVDTIFGIEEDERVLHGRFRVY
jgi:hypothetical protein